VNLIAERLNRGLSLTQAAREIGVHRHTLKTLEAGTAVSPGEAKKIADFYEVKVTDLHPYREEAAA